MRRQALVPILATACVFYSLSAHALGLGRIEMQSALNQRLDAEIPLRGVPGGEAKDVSVGLASEQAFRNVGLDRPFSLTRLRFEVQQRGSGAYFVHVTSRKPIVEPFLSFLVQVNWSGGDLLREYTVLLDPPVFASERAGGSGTTADTASTASGGNEAGMPGEIERDTTDNDMTDDDGAIASRSDSGSMSSGESNAADTGDDDQPVFLQAEEREQQGERSASRTDRQVAQEERSRKQQRGQNDRAATETVSDQGQGEREYGPVASGETLWGIASRLKRGDMTVQQMMVSLLRYNPQAFDGGNINRLKEGYVLRVPNSDTVRSVSAQRAIAQVQDQNGLWREWLGKSRSASTVMASEQSAGASENTGKRDVESQSSDAELSIVGADEGGASSDESASATGSTGASESNKLQLTREQLASTKMEKAELKSRVDELEQTVDKMNKLLSLRSKKLSALQEQLRQARGEQADAADQSGGDPAEDEQAMAGADDMADDSTQRTAEEGDQDENMAAAGAGAAGSGSGSGGSETDGGSTQVADNDSGESGFGENGSGENGSGNQSDSSMASADETGASASDGAGSEEATASTSDSTTGTTTDAAGDADATAMVEQEYVPAGKQATDADREVATTRTEPSRQGWLDQAGAALAGFGTVLAGVGLGVLSGPLGLALLAALLLLSTGVIMMRRRRAEADDDEFDFETVALGTGAHAPAASETPTDGDDGDQTTVERDQLHSASDSEEAESALLAEEFDIGSFDEDDTALADGAAGLDDEDSEKDDTIAEADVYLAYGLHQQAEDLLRLTLREQPDNAVYQEKLLETLYAAGKSDEFVQEAGTLKGMLNDPQSDLWQRTLAMGRDVAPQEPMFDEGETAFSATDVQPAPPVETDLDLDVGTNDIDLSPDETANDGEEAFDDDFASTLMLDASETSGETSGETWGASDDAGPLGPDGSAPAGTSTSEESDDDLEFDLSDLDGLDDDVDEPDSARAATSSSDAPDSEEADALDFDLAEDSESASSLDATSSETDNDGDLDFDFDVESSTASAPASSADTTNDPVEDDDPLDLGDLEVGDLEVGDLEAGDLEAGDGNTDDPGHESPNTEASDSWSVSADDDDDADAFDLSDLDADSTRPEAPGSTGEAAADSTMTHGDEAGDDAGDDARDDAFDLGDLEQTGAGQDEEGFGLDDFASDDAAASNGGTVAEGADLADGNGAEQDEEFDTMLDLARAYIDMGDPDSAGDALDEVAASGNERQRAEAQSLLESVR